MDTTTFRIRILGLAFLVRAGGLSLTIPGIEAQSSTTAAGDFIPVSPKRVVDTRAAFRATAIRENSSVDIDLQSVVPEGATAVALNITVVAPTADTYVFLWPTGESYETSSNLNVGTWTVRANAAIIGLGDNRSITVYNSRGRADVVIDLTGYFTSNFEGMNPVRVMDTRSGLGAEVFNADTERSVRVAGVSGVPDTASAVAVNVTATQPSASTYLTAFPTGSPRPSASTLIVVAGQTAANFSVVPVGDGGRISLYNDSGEVHGVIDVFGWFDEGGRLRPANPRRVLDTRDGSCGLRLGPGEVRTVNIGETEGSAVVVNVTAVEATEGTYLTVFPAGSVRPASSNVNVVPGHAVPNMVLVGTGATGEISIYDDQGSVEVIVDVLAVFEGASFPGTPTRCTPDTTPTTTTPSSSLDPVLIARETGTNLREAQMAIDIFDRVNRERATRGIPMLEWDMLICGELLQMVEGNVDQRIPSRQHVPGAGAVELEHSGNRREHSFPTLGERVGMLRFDQRTPDG